MTYLNPANDPSVLAALAGKEASLGNPSKDGQALVSTMGGTRGWADAASGGGGGLPSRSSASCNTTSISPNAVWNGYIEMPSASADILRVTTNYPAWVRLYATSEALTADVNRPKYQRPRAGHDIISDNITTLEKLSISQNQTSVFHNEDNPLTHLCYVSIKNLDSTDREIILTLECLQKEA